MKKSNVIITGPLAPHLEGAWRYLLSQEYTPLSARNLARLMAHFSRWLEQRKFSPKSLTTAQLEKFFRHRCRQGYVAFRTQRSLKPILDYLTKIGVVRLVERGRVKKRSAIETLLDNYWIYLTKERALGESTKKWYLKVATEFLSEHSDKLSRKLGSLIAEDLSKFVLLKFKKYSISQTKYAVCALRSLLRYLFVKGSIRTDLSKAVPAVAGWRLSSLPKALSGEEVKRLLSACDRRTHAGRRSYAVMILMIRLGLRAGEVAALQLEDINWRSGEVQIHGKAGREDILPLPHDVGQVLAVYLRRRPARGNSRAVFTGIRAPYRRLTSGGILSIISSAFHQVGISSGGAHRLRHTAATEMLRHGASLPEIAQVLRHRHIDTTAIYAKVDFAPLRTLVQTWPGGAV